jgi:hypothetical protein
MMGERTVMQEALFVGFSIERHVPGDHLLRKIDRFVDLSGVRAHVAPYYSDVGRPSIDPELLIRMLLLGYCYGIRSERRLCEEVHLNLAYRWFCRLSLDADVPEKVVRSSPASPRRALSAMLRARVPTIVASGCRPDANDRSRPLADHQRDLRSNDLFPPIAEFRMVRLLAVRPRSKSRTFGR